MILLRRLLLPALLICTAGLYAQDVHFTLYNYSPLTINPAHSGAFLGTFRLGGIYRDQWATVVKSSYRTPNFYIDAPIIKGFRKSDWIGVGLNIIQDQAGTAKLTSGSAGISGAYHLALDKKGRSTLSLGFQYARVSRSIGLTSQSKNKNYDLLRFEDELNGSISGQSPDRSNFNQSNYQDYNAGLLLKSVLKDQSTFELGLSAAHITMPRYGLGGGGGRDTINPNPNPGGGGQAGSDKRPLRMLVHSQYRKELNEKWGIHPSVLFQTTAGAFEFIGQAWTHYLFNEEKDITLNMGLGYRVGDAAQILAGMDIKDLRVALSYDVNLSSLTPASNFHGGFELAVSYIGKIYKKPDVKPVIICPQL